MTIWHYGVLAIIIVGPFLMLRAAIRSGVAAGIKSANQPESAPLAPPAN